MKYENLTQLQKTALEGEISAILSSSHSPADVKIKIYRLLTEGNLKSKSILIENFKELTTIDEEEIDKLAFLAEVKEVPLPLWIEKTIGDIKYYLSSSETSYRLSKLPLNIDKMRKSLVTSMFITFARKVIMISPDAVIKLLTKILEDNELEFLYTSCMYLYGGCQEIKELKCCSESEEISDSILTHELDPNDIMNFIIETECLNKINKINSNEGIKSKKDAQTKSPKIIKSIIIDGNIQEEMSQEELSQFLGNQVLELFNSIHPIKKETKSSSELCYIVQKKYKNTNIKQDIMCCKSEKEAQEFINEIWKEMPELKATCEFIICKKIIEE